MATQPLPQSRTTSVGPPGAGGLNAPPTTTAGGGQQNSQQNLNQIVLEYLSKKGYTRTESTLRKESARLDVNGNSIAASIDEIGAQKFGRAYELTQNWIDNVLDIYKPELRRLLWPLFVYSYLTCVAEYAARDAEDFFKRFREQFEAEHEDDLRAIKGLHDPLELDQNNIAKIYRSNKYRISLSTMAFQTLIMHLEAKENEGGKVVNQIISEHLDVKVIDRAGAGAERNLARLLASGAQEQNYPAEDEGIPGHHPGAANLAANAPAVLAKLSLGAAPMEADLMDDVKAELREHDASDPPGPGQQLLEETFEQRIKSEPNDDAPRDPLPYPPSTARDVAMEVQRVKENRDRFRIQGRTGGVGPGVSVTMFTFHNTFDSINCLEFSGDNTLVAAGTAESYIRVWALDNRSLTSSLDPPSFQPSSSRRLIGHSGPVYALSFSPSIAFPEPPPTGHTNGATCSAPDSQPRYLLSCSADCTIRLWLLDTWTNLVVYRSHTSPVWDVRFSPFGHYFISASADRTARLWSTPQIAPLRLFVGHDSDVETVAWHPNSAYMFTASGSGDRTVRMWDIQRGTAVRIFTGHVGNITALACAPNGQVVASADDRGEIILWDLASGRLSKRMRGHGRGGIWSLDWSVESTVLVSGGADGTVRVWDVQPDSEAPGKVVGEGGAGLKIDGHGVGGNATGKAKTKKDVVVSPDQISAFPTKKSPVYKVRFTQMNLVVAGGAYLP